MRRNLLIMGLILSIGLSVSECVATRADLAAARATEQYDDDLIEVATGHYRRLADVARSERAARAALEVESAGLARAIRRLRARPASVTTVTITAPAETLAVVQVDTVYAETGIRTYRLDWMSGTTWVEADTVYSARHEPAPQNLVLAIYRRPDRTWWADATLEPYGEVSDLRITVSGPGPSWWERNDLWIGYGLGVLTAAAVVGLLKPH